MIGWLLRQLGCHPDQIAAQVDAGLERFERSWAADLVEHEAA